MHGYGSLRSNLPKTYLLNSIGGNCLSRGFSSVELLMGLVIVSLMVAALPALSAVKETLELRSATNSLYYSLMLARSEAIKRNDRVVVCKSITGSMCLTSGGWEQGWIVFVDANNNAKVDGGEEILLNQQRLQPEIHITGNSPLASYVSYKGSGTTAQVSGAFQAGTITACNVSSAEGVAHKIVVSAVGKVRQVNAKVPGCLNASIANG
jgi:type IV fimbrial biogenesis protein FimT